MHPVQWLHTAVWHVCLLRITCLSWGTITLSFVVFFFLKQFENNWVGGVRRSVWAFVSARASWLLRRSHRHPSVIFLFCRQVKYSNQDWTCLIEVDPWIIVSDEQFHRPLPPFIACPLRLLTLRRSLASARRVHLWTRRQRSSHSWPNIFSLSASRFNIPLHFLLRSPLHHHSFPPTTSCFSPNR